MLVEPSGELRQGDVCTISGFPLWDRRTALEVRDADGRLSSIQIPTWDKPFSVSESEVLAVICSHDCDLENPRSRTGLAIAPLLPVPASQDSDRYSLIMSSGQLIGGEYAHINLFPLTLPGGAEDGRDVVVDFSAITTLARSSDAAKFLDASKRFEMDDETRRGFKQKLRSVLWEAVGGGSIGTDAVVVVGDQVLTGPSRMTGGNLVASSQ